MVPSSFRWLLSRARVDSGRPSTVISTLAYIRAVEAEIMELMVLGRQPSEGRKHGDSRFRIRIPSWESWLAVLQEQVECKCLQKLAELAV